MGPDSLSSPWLPQPRWHLSLPRQRGCGHRPAGHSLQPSPGSPSTHRGSSQEPAVLRALPLPSFLLWFHRGLDQRMLLTTVRGKRPSRLRRARTEFTVVIGARRCPSGWDRVQPSTALRAQSHCKGLGPSVSASRASRSSVVLQIRGLALAWGAGRRQNPYP